jgi:cellulose synthase/poly-beta-1,6-N-acetylglucosamine synthase-like glycosyltransferase
MLFEYATWESILRLLANVPLKELAAFLIFPLLFEFPRYLLGFPSIVMMYLRDRKAAQKGALKLPPNLGKVSILIAGHNEADAIENGVKSLMKQSFRDFEIVCVSDGSTDDTYEIMKRLQREGLVQKVAGNQTRGGKASAINLGARLASGDILIVIDCDCTFEEHAIAEILMPFWDPQVAGVSASVLVKNSDASFCASIQGIEYLQGMVLGKAQLEMFGQLCMISGAFGAFRKDAWNRVNGMDPGPGEDLDISLRLRFAGYKLAFAHRAIAYTDVPTSYFNLFRQRNRWERDLIWLRFRKHGWAFNPFGVNFKPKEMYHQIDVILWTLIPTAIFIPYMAMCYLWLGDSFWPLMATVTMMGFVFDICVFTCAVIAIGDNKHWRLLPFLLVYGVIQSWVMRQHRLYAMANEWIYSVSREDSFAPPKVNAWIRWK